MIKLFIKAHQINFLVTECIFCTFGIGLLCLLNKTEILNSFWSNLVLPWSHNQQFLLKKALESSNQIPI